MRIRDLEERDLPFMRDMLYTAVTWRPGGDHPPKDVALVHPLVAMYHEAWGRTGDVGFVAEDDSRLLGAAFYRFFTDEHHGHGYVDPQTPELGIAVVEDARGRGIGRALLNALAERARRDGVQRIALSVNDDNPAKKLYASLGYEEFEPGDGHGRMILKLGEV